MAKDKVVLAYSGGLDTSIIIHWLKENYDYDVICCCIDVGQGNELDGLEERAKYSGAERLYILDVVDEFVDEYKREIERIFGKDSCHILEIRNYGGVKVI